ncbi:MAG: diguanylate cyclase [Defluviitaleaceae bacterium]|nr:diguanylate cyclase [Defluviitaleaceae bacterium]
METQNDYNPPDLVAMLRSEFIKAQCSTIAKLQEALSTLNYKVAHLLVHTLKGNAGLINESTLVKLALDIVPILKAGQMPEKSMIESLEIELDRVLKDIATSSPAAQSETDVQCKLKYNVLVIDDSPLEIMAAKAMLSKSYNVFTALNSEDGIAIARKNEINIILLDLNMPGKSGFETLSDLKRFPETSKIPVIMATGSESSYDEERALELGASDFISKPFVASIINLRVNMHLQLREYIKSVEKQSLMDGLTGIGNRRAFEQSMRIEWSRATRKSEWLGMIILDIDFFKKFNDTHGHLNGDICLKAVADIMVKSVARGYDYVFRWGGEEFVAVLPDTSPEGVVAVAERIHKNIANTPIKIANETVSITASLSAGAIVPKPDQVDEKTKQDEFFTKLDEALYRAKEKGRNRVEIL